MLCCIPQLIGSAMVSSIDTVLILSERHIFLLLQVETGSGASLNQLEMESVKMAYMEA